MWEFNNSYQTPIERPEAAALTELDLKDPKVFENCLGNDDCYSIYLKFFEDEIAQKGVPEVVREYVLKGDERANDIFCRMYTGKRTHIINHFSRSLPNTDNHRPCASDNPSRVCY